MGAVTLNALAASQMLIIPTQPEYFSAHALRTMITTVRQAHSSYNPQLIYRILITLLDRRNRIHRQVSEHIRAAFGEHVFHTVIEIDTKLRESAVEGMPVTHHRSQSRSAQQYSALAQEVIAHAA
jgi:chromosome partitioning protein